MAYNYFMTQQIFMKTSYYKVDKILFSEKSKKKSV